MIKNKMVLENNSLFLGLDQAISQLADALSPYQHSEILLVVLCEDAMPVASEISRRLEYNLTFSPPELDANTADSTGSRIQVQFDYGMVKESGRDIPQDFILHQEKTLRSNLISMYNSAYKNLSKEYPRKVIILVDQLTNIDSEFFPCLIHRSPSQSGGKSFSDPAIRQFVYLHVSDGALKDFDMIVDGSSSDIKSNSN